MKNIFKNLFVIALVAICSFALVACGDSPSKEDNKETEIDWNSKTIADEGVTLDEASFKAVYDIDDFKVSMLKLHIVYTDGAERDIPCTKEMFEDTDYKKLSSPGTKKVTIYYDVYEFDTKVNLVDYAVYDMNLNKNKTYDVVVKVIRNQRTNKLEFIVDPITGIAGMQARFVFDEGKIELSNFVTNEATKGYGQYTFDKANKLLTIDFVTLENITEEGTVLFSCDYAGDFRFSGLKIDETYENKVYTINEEGNTEKLLKVLYHVSQK